MNILGLHFGHDAGVCVVRKGRIASYIARERYSRTRHAISLEFRNIEAAVAAAGLRMDQIDYCAITSTQQVELIIDEPTRFSINLSAHPKHTAPCTYQRMLPPDIDPATLLTQSMLKTLYDPAASRSFLFHQYADGFPEHRGRRPENFSAFGWMDKYFTSKLWPGATLGQISATDFSPLLANDDARHGFHYPVTVNLDGRAVPGYFVAHHAAHAASTYYQSGFRNAAIFTHDGFSDGAGNLSGMFYWADEGKIFPITPHHFTVGALYEATAVQLDLGAVGAPGMLMELAAYGKPRFYDRAFVGNWYDHINTGIKNYPWKDHVVFMARNMGYDMAPVADRARITAPINADIAASTQKLFEETYLAGVETLHKVIARMGRRTSNLCLSGDAALNCPSNTRLFREGRFPNLFVEPGCDDGGLAVGVALYLFHNVFDQKLAVRPPGAAASPYMGLPISDDQIKAALEASSALVDFSPCADAADSAAQDLVEDRIIGWFEDRSEIGSRALGHRSILADPTNAQNRARVNTLKGRELWRPFAAAVLESEAAKWFGGVPDPAPYMSFTAAVRTHDAPAITQPDGTARIQTIGMANGEIGRVIEQFFAMTGMPIVLNASFNGPSEPLVETPAEAIRFLIASTLDALYMGGFRVTRKLIP